MSQQRLPVDRCLPSVLINSLWLNSIQSTSESSWLSAALPRLLLPRPTLPGRSRLFPLFRYRLPINTRLVCCVWIPRLLDIYDCWRSFTSPSQSTTYVEFLRCQSKRPVFTGMVLAAVSVVCSSTQLRMNTGRDNGTGRRLPKQRQQEAQLLLRDRATRKPAKDSVTSCILLHTSTIPVVLWISQHIIVHVVVGVMVKYCGYVYG